MNDHASPGLDRTCRGWAAIEAADAAARERLARELEIENRTPHPGGARRDPDLPPIRETPHWPPWAIRLGSAGKGCCATCGLPIPSATRRRAPITATSICGDCGHRLGGSLRQRVRLTLAAWARGEGKP